jgi:hypothetical protein
MEVMGYGRERLLKGFLLTLIFYVGNHVLRERECPSI